MPATRCFENHCSGHDEVGPGCTTRSVLPLHSSHARRFEAECPSMYSWYLYSACSAGESGGLKHRASSAGAQWTTPYHTRSRGEGEVMPASSIVGVLQESMAAPIRGFLSSAKTPVAVPRNTAIGLRDSHGVGKMPLI